MSVFTKINKSQLISIIADYDLGKLIDYRGISEGIENSNFIFFLTENMYVLIMIPIKAPWKDIPPSQILKISTGLEI